ncbi:MAG: crossover junction endodeoxyribonuclease RuvC [Verrucomicrobiota bacterium]|jgi:crossover junction endodeoxyribonuclease RuvC
MSVTACQYEELKARLSGARRVAQPVQGSSLRPGLAGRQIIIGIDPSLRGTGYGVIRVTKPHPVVLAHGTIACPPGWPHSRCLLKIAQTLREITAKHHPTVCAIEGLFFAQNLQTALTLGQARGAALTVMAEAGLDIYEIAPRKVKQAIVGYGAAQKEAVTKMVQRLLQLSQAPAPDAADALAIALAHAQNTSRYTLSAPKKI